MGEKILIPTLNQLLENSNGFNLLSFCRDGIRMGSDGRHSIQSMQLLFDSFISHQLLVLTGLSRSSIYNVMLFFKSQPSFIRTLMMAMSSLCLRSVSTVPNSSIITSISHNGQSWAVKVAGLPEPLVMSDVDSGICYAGDSFSLDVFGLGTFLLPYFQYNASLLCGFDMSLDALIKLNSDRCYATHSEFLNVLSVSQPFALA